MGDSRIRAAEGDHRGYISNCVCRVCEANPLRSMEFELRERRAADLTAEERDAMVWARSVVLRWRNPFNPELVSGSMKSAALATLDKVLGKDRGDRVDSIGRCSLCGYEGPGPKHDCKARP